MKGRRHQPREIAGQGAECGGQEPASGAERDAEQAGGDQGEGDPEQSRRDEGVIVDRGGRHAFGCQHDLIALALHLPEQKRPRAPGAGGRDEAAARGAGGFGRSGAAGAGDRQPPGLDPGRQEHGGSTCRQPEQSGGGDPAQAGAREEIAAQQRESGEASDGEPEQDPGDADGPRFEGDEAQDLRDRGAADAQERLLLPPASGARNGDGMGEQDGQERARHAEEEKQDSRIKRVAAHRIQSGGEIVGDNPGAGDPCLEIAGRPGNLVIGRRRVGRQAVMRQAHMELAAHRAWLGNCQRIEQLMPLGQRQDHDIVGGRLRGEARRQADRLEQRIRILADRRCRQP